MSSNNYGSISKQQQQQQPPSQSLSKAERDLLQADRPGYGDRSKVEVAFNLVNATVGAGIMGLPYAISHAGFVTGIVASIWVAILSQLGLYMVILAGKQTGIYKYAVLVEYVMGRFGYHLLNFMIIAQAGGGVISYFICKHMTKTILNMHIHNPINATMTHHILLYCSVGRLHACTIRTILSIHSSLGQPYLCRWHDRYLLRKWISFSLYAMPIQCTTQHTS